MNTVTFYEKQYYCEKQGYRCKGQLEGLQFRVLQYKNDQFLKPGPWVNIQQIPEAYRTAYEEIYEFLTKSNGNGEF